MTAIAPSLEPMYAAEISPTATVSTTSDEYVVKVDAAGFRPAEVDVEVSKSSLHVQGHAASGSGLPRPDFEFWFSLPPRADERSIRAIFNDGTLSVRVGLGIEQGLRRIPVEAA